MPTEFESHVTDMLARLDTKMDTLVGGDGRVPKLEEKVEELQKKTWVFGGALIGIGGFVHWAIDAYHAFKH